MKLHENQLNLIRHLIRFNLMAYEDCLEMLDTNGSNNKRVWDTSNRAINVVINNLKGIFFGDDDFAHMACGVVADWGDVGCTEIRICALDELERCDIFFEKLAKN